MLFVTSPQQVTLLLHLFVGFPLLSLTQLKVSNELNRLVSSLRGTKHPSVANWALANLVKLFHKDWVKMPQERIDFVEFHFVRQRGALRYSLVFYLLTVVGTDYKSAIGLFCRNYEFPQSFYAFAFQISIFTPLLFVNNFRRNAFRFSAILLFNQNFIFIQI